MAKRTVTRRGVLGGAAFVAAAAATGALGGLEASIAGAATPTFPQLRQLQFDRLVGKSFGVRGGATRTSITLASVTPLTMRGLPRNRNPRVRTTGEQYSLDFTGPTSSSFPQGTYTLSTPGLGSFGLLLVPVGQPDGDQQYQAIIVSV
ncbi:MAG: DUF6916 family protein [Acidimicrobiales bacterium]|jgi:hypothetical protein